MSKTLNKKTLNQKKDKNNISKNPKLSPTSKLSELVTNIKNPEESKILQQQQQAIESHNMLLSYYSQKDSKNNIINNFIEKIRKLNNKFYICSEKYILTKASFDKLSDDLYLNLFKQIDCYVEEIQRLNEKITSINNKDNKITIKKLTKELSENKEKIRAYELKLKEKTTKEEQLIKEIESYKRRIIFFKNKINLNLLPRNQGRTRLKNYMRQNTNINDSMINKNSNKNDYLRTRGYTYKSKNKKFKKFFSPSPEKLPKKNNNESFLSTKNIVTILPCLKEKRKKEKINSSIININPITTISNFDKSTNNYSDKNLITVNNNSKNIFSDGEFDNDRAIIKIHRKIKPKESIIVPFNKNYNKDDDENSKINIKNFDDLNKNININEYIEQHLTPTNKEEQKSNKYSPKVPKKLDNYFDKLDRDSINNNKEEIILNNGRKISDLNRNKKSGKLKPSHFSTLDIKNKTKTEKKFKNITLNNNSNIKNTKYKPITGRKLFPFKKIFNLPSKKVIKSNLKNNSNKFKNNNTNTNSSNYNTTINNTINITLDDIKNNTMENFNPVEKSAYRILNSKTVKFKDNETLDKEQQLHFTGSESENNDNFEISSKQLSVSSKRNDENKKILEKFGNKASSYQSEKSDTYSKGTVNNENVSSGDNSLILKKNKTKEIKKKNLKNTKSFGTMDKKQDSNKTKIFNNKNNSNSEKDKEKEMVKILKEMNEDYNNDIEMLKTQEEQIKFLLNIINLNEN